MISSRRRRRDPAARRLRVQSSIEMPDGTTRFDDQINTELPDDIQPLHFTWPRALLGRYDVFHMHWPDALMRTPGPSNVITHVLYAVLLFRWWALGTPLVWTVHNLAPHESVSRGERWLFAATVRLTTAFVRLNSQTPFPDEREGNRTILHGHYRDSFSHHARADQVDNVMLFFGQIRPYKGIDTLLGSFGSLDQRWQLRIVGRTLDDDLATRIRHHVDSVDRISADLRTVGDDELVREMSRAEVVVLPYQQLHNSGVLLAALSLGRPVIVPDTISTAALAAEVGDEWVVRLSGPLSETTLQESLAVIETGRAARRGHEPAMPERDWVTVGRSYADVYRFVARGLERNER